ncbi:hypothetical protein [Ferrimicrobium sp.]|uniref:hypothetical protein n=1 Tax=Ferrimicrobium sp. TaxID=2926050 RepID=UPI002613E716|nr:hypothetical protein [Ferrimicrobium sp.]
MNRLRTTLWTLTRRLSIGKSHVHNSKGTVLLGSLVLASVLLSSCGASATAEADQACTLVHKSIQIYDSAQTADSAKARAELARAELLLAEAVSPANLAASTDSYWQPLAGTLAESNQLPESRLVIALRAQCAPSATNQGEYVVPYKSQGQ